MVKNNLLIALRQFRDFYSLLNLVGLVIGFTVFIVLITWVNEELSYDLFHRDYQSIYRVIGNVNKEDGSIRLSAQTPSPLAATLQTQTEGVQQSCYLRQTEFFIKHQETGFYKLGLVASPEFFRMFNFPITKGSIEAFEKETDKIIISEKLAHVFFGDEDPIGKVFTVAYRDLEVIAVIQDVPSHSHMQFDYVIPVVFLKAAGIADLDSWSVYDYLTYIKTNSDKTLVELKIKDVINVLMGTLTSTAKTYKHNKVETWGKGIEHDKDDKFWHAVLRQIVVNGFLAKDIENYGLLRLTDKGHLFLKKPYSVKFTHDHDYNSKTKDTGDDDIALGGKGGSGASDEVLYALLKDQVKKLAKAKGLPPYVIFQEPSLEEMAIQYPITMDEMVKISGVGTGKAAKYGKPFIELIKKYVEENEIERPVDMVIKSVVNKSGLKVYIIQNIDRRIGLKEMARSKNLTIPNLLTEIETIVESGTKVNINYYIDDLMDEEKQDEIIEYFKESESDSVQAALKELGENDYSEEEIRVMRIKFLSDFGN